MKIHQKSDAEMAHAQIGQKLRFMRRDEGRNAFDSIITASASTISALNPTETDVPL
jgi:hypothetical protein